MTAKDANARTQEALRGKAAERAKRVKARKAKAQPRQEDA